MPILIFAKNIEFKQGASAVIVNGQIVKLPFYSGSKLKIYRSCIYTVRNKQNNFEINRREKIKLEEHILQNLQGFNDKLYVYISGKMPFK